MEIHWCKKYKIGVIFIKYNFNANAILEVNCEDEFDKGFVITGLLSAIIYSCDADILYRNDLRADFSIENLMDYENRLMELGVDY